MSLSLVLQMAEMFEALAEVDDADELVLKEEESQVRTCGQADLSSTSRNDFAIASWGNTVLLRPRLYFKLSCNNSTADH